MEYKKLSGMSVLEMMLSIFLSSLIVIIVFRYTFFLEKSLNHATEKMDIIEKYHVAFAWLVNDIEMAGYMGCVNADSRFSISDPGGYLWKTWLQVNDDVLQSQYMSPQAFKILEQVDNTLLIDGDNNLNVNDVIVIENCWQAEVAKIKQISSVNYGAEKRLYFYTNLTIINGGDVYISKLIQHRFFIKNTTRKNASGDWVSSLYVSDINARDEEVLENINGFNFSTNATKIMINLKESQKNITIQLNARKRNAA